MRLSRRQIRWRRGAGLAAGAFAIAGGTVALFTTDNDAASVLLLTRRRGAGAASNATSRS